MLRCNNSCPLSSLHARTVTLEIEDAIIPGKNA